MNNQFGKKIIVFFIISLLAACSSTPQIKTTIQAANFLNPNIYNQASPVVVTVYQLKSPTIFEQSNFFALSNNAASVLTSDLLDKRDIEIQPGQSQIVHIASSPQASYLGVIAAFRNPDSAKWRQVVAITPGKSVRLKINLATQSVTISLK